MVLPELTIPLHAGQEVTLLAYLYRVLVYLVAFGGIAGLTYWFAGLVGPSQSRFVAEHSDEHGE